jgi:dihydroorotate dehydrogenase (NAD+) catalytic subunit
MSILETSVGSVALRSPVMTAAGTAGYGDELSGYGDLMALGAVVVKSLATFQWDGNPAPRVASIGNDMINAVGLSGPGIAAWRETYLPDLLATGATVVGSIWGRNIGEFADAAAAIKGANIAALEVNASCPNLEDRSSIFAHSASATSEIVRATKVAGVPLWVKLSPNTPDLVAVAGAAIEAGADALVLVNTVVGLAIDIEKRSATLGNGGGGVSGPGILPIALRAVFECHSAYPQTAIVGVGGISSGEDAVAMMMAGASAVEVGTATFANARAPWMIQKQLEKWLKKQGISNVSEIIGAAHG